MVTPMAEFPRLRHPARFAPGSFVGFTRPRGMRCDAPRCFAEGFHAPELRL